MSELEDLPQNEEYQFTVGIYDYILKPDDWPLITNRPFENEEASWPPIDKQIGSFKIYHKGKIVPSDKTNCEGLEVAAVWRDEHIVD
ncbi:hypothetical protein [Paenibacillus radicis (ex Xue et al. 2023)]|uniref:Uncharacterized protein n=1 Tax=Paenibacillus radicis (ex Xue et al. 2023) TaxID=2972489 RepID=A0ABT1YF37_9BACL|nr:hypothetical protein [Paenibacillus radicis (ex Xue et al. 2023)]MCR8630570.1 hypothetical protein [Paenibacillus radicis (ex Xue et al. 2023)]